MGNHCFNRYIDYLSTINGSFSIATCLITVRYVLHFQFPGRSYQTVHWLTAEWTDLLQTLGFSGGLLPMGGSSGSTSLFVENARPMKAMLCQAGHIHWSGFIGHSFCLDSHGMDHTDHTPWIFHEFYVTWPWQIWSIFWWFAIAMFQRSAGLELPTSGTFTVAAAHSGIAGTIHCTPAVELAGNVDPGLTGA